MSHLSDETKVVYTPVIYNANREILYEGGDHRDEDSAIEEAQSLIAHEISRFVKYVHAVIEKRVVPIYH